MSPRTPFVRARLAFLAVATAIALGATASAAPVEWPKIPTPPPIPTPPEPPRPPEPPAPPLSPIEKEFAERFKKLVEEASKEALPKPKQPKQETFDEFITKLLNEFGPDARFGATSRFVMIYDTTDAYALWCAALMENVASTYEAFVSRVRLVESGLFDPMVVFVFAEKEKYEEFLQKTAGSEFANDAQRPVGFYEHASNRCVFYDLTGEEQNRADKTEKRTLEQVASDVLKQPNGDQNLSTIVHEATHQVSFNYGLFSRQGENPSWAVEGLSMLFEAPSGEPKDGGWKVVDEKAKKIVFPVNKRRLMEFQQYVSTTTDSQPVKKCVGLEKIRGDEPCAYPLSWAIFYYLYRNNPKVLAQYLMDSASVQPRLSYSSRERVYEFAYYFGDDWDGMFLELRAFADALDLEIKGVDPAEAQKQTRAKYNLPERPVVFGMKNVKKSGTEKKSASDRKSNGAAKSSGAANADKDAAKAPEEKNALPTPVEKSKSDRKSTPTERKSPEKKSPDLDDWLKEWSKDKNS